MIRNVGLRFGPDMAEQGDDVLVSFANAGILVNDVTVKELNDGGNFFF